MSVATFAGIVQNGQIKLPENLHLPEQTKVYVVVPGVQQPGTMRVLSPRLAHREQSQDFKKTIIPNADV